MKIVQDALAGTNIPAYALAWRATDEHPTPPETYLVYTTRTYESEHWDDDPQSYTLAVYLNMWTSSDPTDAILTVRAAMRGAGFGMDNEAVTYEQTTEQTLVAWTWMIELKTEVNGNGT